MKWTKSLIVICCSLVVVGMLTGCGSSSKEEKGVLNLYSWADNFDPEVIKSFEEEFNVKVNYDVFDSNETMLAKIQGGATYDLIQPSDYMVDIMVKQGLLEKLNKENLPNLAKTDMAIKDTPYDPNGEYSTIYMYGITGIGYNTKHVKEVPTSWNALWDGKYKGHIAVLKDSREAMGMGLIKNGYSNSSLKDAELEKAFQDMKQLKSTMNPILDTDNIKDKFISEDIWIGTLWSGDAMFVEKSNPDVKYIVPEEGATIFADTFAIPKGSKNKELAEKFINYLLDAEISVKNYEYTGYINPDESVFDKHSDEYKNSEIMKYVRTNLNSFKTEWLMDVGDKTPEYSRYWDEFSATK